MNLEEFALEWKRREKHNKKFLRRLKERPPRALDDVFHRAHHDVFASTDCLACANCCKTTSPIFYQRDIDRAAQALKLKPGRFIDRYLKVDEDGDYVLRSAPCAFLQEDNRCAIYEDRPAACREYPHTNRKRMHQILDLTFRNTRVCPAVLKIVEQVGLSITGKS